MRSGAILLLLLLVSTVPSARAAMETKARHALLMDFDTGAVLLEKDADVAMPPSSMSKLMTAYMVFRELKEGRLSLDSELPVSENAWKKGGAASGGSTMFLAPNSKATVADLLRGIIVQSGNDACIVVAENIAGSEQAFADQMTAEGKRIGLKNSTFKNASGWPMAGHEMTSYDLARLARRIILDFPEYYPLYAEQSFTYNGIKQDNRNPLLYKSVGADGLKTGHTEAAGYGLTASAKQGDRRLILVLNGLDSIKERSAESERLMEWGFRNFDNLTVLSPGQVVAKADVWMGDAEKVDLVSPTQIRVTLPRAGLRAVTAKVVYEAPLPAPVAKGEEVAKFVVSAPDVAPMSFPLVAGEDVAPLGPWGRIGANIRYLVRSWLG